MRLRERLLADGHDDRYRRGEGTEPAQWEVVALLLRDLARHYPRFMSLGEDGDRWTWETRMLGGRTAFRFGDRESLPASRSTGWAGRSSRT